jgi:alternate signal-mediated exported protein
MNKTTKGAFAASAAAVLLLGGAGSLAYWSDAETISGGSVTAGNLSLDTPSCTTGWKYAAGKAGAGTTVTKIVPGDVITKTCTFVVKGAGDNLSATLTAPQTTTAADSVAKADVDVKYTLGGTAMTSPATITPADHNKVVSAVITVSFPYGTDEAAGTKVNANNTQDVTTSLNDIAITLVQKTPNA